MNEELKVYEEKMEKSINAMMDEFASIRAGRANPHAFLSDSISVGSPGICGGCGRYTGNFDGI